MIQQSQITLKCGPAFNVLAVTVVSPMRDILISKFGYTEVLLYQDFPSALKSQRQKHSVQLQISASCTMFSLDISLHSGHLVARESSCGK